MLQTLLLVLPAVAGMQDLTVSRVGSGGGAFAYYGTSEGKAAYSFATTSCNVGDQVIDWYAGASGRHPVIAQNFFRIHDGRFEQLGQSWLKHGFCAINENSCGSCQSTNCDTLGIGCADTYSSALNDGQGGGAKSDISAATGHHSHPVTGPTGGNGVLRGRLQVEVAELGIEGATYVAEAQYMSEHDQLGGNARNNASWRPIDTEFLSSITATGLTRIGDPAIYAWAEVDPDVTITEVVNVDEGGAGVHGYFFVGFKATDLLDGRWRYDYAVQNLTSERAAGSFTVPFACDDVTITDVFFRDVDYHSGEVYANDDWTATATASGITWASQTTYAQDPFGNALRWGTAYTFGFVADAAPTTVTAELGLYATGSPADLTFGVAAPCGDPPCGVTTTCAGAGNSFTGAGAAIATQGSTSLAANDLAFLAYGIPPGESALFFYGPSHTQVPFGDGELCVGPPHRRVAPVMTADVFGEVFLHVDYDSPPFDAGWAEIHAGDTWFFQLWYRDPAAGGSGYNMSSGVKAVFCP